MSNELYHWGFKKKHKYIAKVKVKPKRWRYFYDKKEYEAYLKGLKENKQLNNKSSFTNKVKNGMNFVTGLPKIGLDAYIEKNKKKAKLRAITNPILNEIKSIAKPVEDVVNEKVAAVKAIVTNKIMSSEVKDHKYIAKVQMSDGSYRYFYDQDEYDAYLKRQEYQDNEPDYMANLPEIDGPETFENALLEVNENYRMFNDGVNGEYYSMNCMLCTTAYELRRRGYDVEALPMTIDFLESTKLEGGSYKENTYNYASLIYKNPEFTTVPTENLSDLSGYLSTTLEPNTRGNMMVKWSESSGGHSVIYEVDSTGNVKIMDSQIANLYGGDVSPVISSDESTINYYGRYSSEIYLMRTDNLTFSEEGVKVSVREN